MTAADQTAFAAALDGGPLPGGVHDGRGRPASDRLRVYQNNVAVSLADALAATFRATERLMGTDYFRSAAHAYARKTKPRSPLLFAYGDTFPDFLAALPGLGPYPFVPECARIEHRLVMASHAADARPLAPDALAAVPPDALGAIAFATHPAARLVSTPSGGLDAWVREGGRASGEADAVAVLVTRPADRLLVHGLGGATARFAGALLAGRPLGEAAEVKGLDVAGALALLLSAGAFSALQASRG